MTEEPPHRLEHLTARREETGPDEPLPGDTTELGVARHHRRHAHAVPLRYTRALAFAVALVAAGATIYLLTLGHHHSRTTPGPTPSATPTPTRSPHAPAPRTTPGPRTTVIVTPGGTRTVIVSPAPPRSSRPAHHRHHPRPSSSPSSSPSPSPTPSRSCLAYSPLTGKCLTVALNLVITAIRGGPFR